MENRAVTAESVFENEVERIVVKVDGDAVLSLTVKEACDLAYNVGFLTHPLTHILQAKAKP